METASSGRRPILTRHRRLWRDRISETDAADVAFRLPDHHGNAFARADDAYLGARLLRLTKYGLQPVSVERTNQCKVMREFCNDPAEFVEAVMEE
jgi:hypothetical protein